MKKALLAVALVALFVLGCTSTGDKFLIQKLDDQSKAQALTTAGIEEYQLYLVSRQAFDQIPRVRDYFNTALQFDPSNTQAQQYLDLIDNFKDQKLKVNVTAATKTLAKPKRTDDENYALFVSLQTASRIDAKDPAVQKMLVDTAQDRAKLADSYIVKAKASLAGMNDKTPAATQEKQYTDAYPNVSRALDIDPKNATAAALMSTVKTAVGKLVAARVATFQTLLSEAKYADARTQLTGLADLNRKTGNNYDADVRTATYNLNITWARAYFALKDYPNADTRTDAALAASRTAEATALKKQITAIRGKADTAATFDATVADIDKLIGSGQLVSAQRKINALGRTTSDQTKQASLDTRAQAILDKIKDIYAQGVDAYRAENYKDAISLLETVVGVQVDYEQAGDYLDKARQKQKVIDQVGG